MSDQTEIQALVAAVWEWAQVNGSEFDDFEKAEQAAWDKAVLAVKEFRNRAVNKALGNASRLPLKRKFANGSPQELSDAINALRGQP